MLRSVAVFTLARCLSVRLSVTRQYCIEKTASIIKRSTVLALGLLEIFQKPLSVGSINEAVGAASVDNTSSNQSAIRIHIPMNERWKRLKD